MATTRPSMRSGVAATPWMNGSFHSRSPDVVSND